ncbi:PREDICTED: alpha-N-acetylneuraminide alpha-2,8-sialyltransferase-like [Branchiostoma belcheri]|uniref:Alpha-N-acetylneuraminide alpha-2,8-sialyltransferase-like n=1 Tax=Branchiostoma belcheri TaxID=7741 RepID=A0A6P4ZEN6_BRABE|nr:PREDICTED: alpha-N-acetylneuraminide alpha-2,8-sialyltransferase-like [Branchiostoma belcheri]
MGRPAVSVVSGCLAVSIFMTLGQIWRIGLLSDGQFGWQTVTTPPPATGKQQLVLSAAGRFTQSRAVLNSTYDSNTKTFYGSAGAVVNNSDIMKLYSNSRVLHPPATILQLLNNIQAVRWMFNDSAIHNLRSRLENATRTNEQFILTRQNAPLNTDINFSAQNGKFTITERIFAAEPATSPLTNRTFETCSLVGNSGLLKGSGCGREIDKSDFIIRFNMPPVISHWREDIGTRTSMVTTNIHTIVSRFHQLHHNMDWTQAFRNFIRNCNLQSTHILTFPFNVRGNGDFFLDFQETLKRNGIKNQVLMNHPDHRRLVSDFWAKEGLNEPTPTSGFYLVSAALAFCKHVRIFGFWPFLTNRQGAQVDYHYTLNYLHRDGGLTNWNHRIDREFFKLVELYRDGVVELVTGTCR